jgi:ferredoxin-NADP reductase
VRVEGPYGRFDIGRQDRRAQQLWVAGGIGVTPFLAWLESLQARPDDAPAAELHYCTGDRDVDPFVTRIESLCAPLLGIRLQVHGLRQGEELTAASWLPARIAPGCRGLVLRPAGLRRGAARGPASGLARAADFSSGGVCHALGRLPLCRNRSRKPHFTAGARLVYQ